MALILLFKLGNARYGLEIDAIQEIIESPQLHFTPRAREVLTGSINFHGQVLAVIDLPALLGFAAESPDHRKVVLAPSFRSLALTVSGIERIISLDLSSIQPPAADDTYPAVRGVVDHEGLGINLLDVDAVIKKLENIFAE